jgi:hypothetical protein
MTRLLLAVAVLAASFGASWGSAQNGPTVALIRLPAGGIQPQAEVDARGVAHVVYFAGDPPHGDLFYSRVAPDGTFSAPLRVNSVDGTAIAIGTVRGARLALGRNGAVHVAWNGSDRATTTGGPVPMLYARLNAARTGFDPQRNLIQHAVGIDGGGAIAADGSGRVFVAWHAGGPQSKGEGDRRVWLAESRDDGRTFSRERPISPAETGACGCCGMDGLVTPTGELFFLYRSAREVVNRESYLLAAGDAGRTFRAVLMESWNVGACPMSTYELVAGQGAVLAAWETGGQVRYSRISTDMTSPAIVTPSGTAANRRHPSLAINARGEVLMSWSEGTSWQRGGSLAWQVFDATGRPVGAPGHAAGVPVWGMTAAIARPDGSFAIVY